MAVSVAVSVGAAVSVDAGVLEVTPVTVAVASSAESPEQPANSTVAMIAIGRRGVRRARRALGWIRSITCLLTTGANCSECSKYP